MTGADIAAERVICSRLAALLPGVTILAEEAFDAARHPSVPDRFILLDPLDGTREFISGSDEFTVNIALIEAGTPVAGTIFAPALKELYLAGENAYQTEVEPGVTLQGLGGLSTIQTAPVPGTGIRAVGSRSHMDAETTGWLQRRAVAQMRAAGSSLKFCVVARGDADVYPRLAPTMEWDTAAGHAILKAAGGCVLDTSGGALRYGKAERKFKNGWISSPGALLRPNNERQVQLPMHTLPSQAPTTAVTPLTRHLKRLEVGIDRDHARGRGRVPQAGDALFDRQGFQRDAAPGDQGFSSGAAAVSRCCMSTRPGNSAR